MKYFLALITIYFLVGCSTHPVDPKITMKPPSYVEQLPPKINEKDFSNKGSLFGRGDNPLFSDRKAMKVNDLVTIIIEERANQSSRGNKKITDDSRNKLDGGLFSTTQKNGLVNKLATELNNGTNLGFQAGSKNTFTASGMNTRDEKFSTTTTARVIKILNNGNYFIEGSKELLLDGNKQYLQISGVIRPYDIDQSNTINSKYIADAKIMYKTQGDISQATTKPWGSKFVENIWPF